MGKSVFMQNLTADNKSIKAKRGALLETTFLTELDAEINDLTRQKIAAESTISRLLDFAPTNTQSLTFGNIGEGASEDAKKVLVEYHNAKLRLKMEIEPSLAIYKEIKDDLFTVQNEE